MEEPCWAVNKIKVVASVADDTWNRSWDRTNGKSGGGKIEEEEWTGNEQGKDNEEKIAEENGTKNNVNIKDNNPRHMHMLFWTHLVDRNPGKLMMPSKKTQTQGI